MTRRTRFVWLAALALLGAPALASAETPKATLTLDGLSLISFGDREIYPLPAGSTIEFEFGKPQADGSIPFTIQPSGVSIGAVPLRGEQGELRYALASPASGTMRSTPEGRELRFTASVSVTRVTEQGEETLRYAIPFTTESASARNLAGTARVEKSGMRMVESARYLQLVGATTNQANAYPEPGAAVYAVLSGRFDRLP